VADSLPKAVPGESAEIGGAGGGNDNTFRTSRFSHTTKCLLRRQTGSQHDPVHLQVAVTLLPCTNAKGGGVCRAATDFDCAAVTLRRGQAVTFECFRRLTLRSATGFSQREKRHQMQANRVAARPCASVDFYPGRPASGGTELQTKTARATQVCCQGDGVNLPGNRPKGISAA